MPLRVLDLRGTEPPFDGALPRPGGARSGRPRHGGAHPGAGARRGRRAPWSATRREFDKVDVSDGLRVPAAEIERGLRRRRPRPAARPSRWPTAASSPTTPTRAHRRATWSRAASRSRHLTRPVGRAGLYAPGGRARYPSTVLMCAAPARVAGVGSIALCVPPAADGRVDDATLCAAAVAGVDEVYRVGGAQAIAAMAYGTRQRAAGRRDRRPGQPLRGRGQAPGRRASSAWPSAFAGPSEVVVVAGPGTPPSSPPSTSSSRPSTAPTGWPGWSPGTATSPTRSSAEVDRIVAASPRRADLESTLATAGIAVPGRRARAGAARSPTRSPPSTWSSWCPRTTPRRCSSWCSNAGAVFLGPLVAGQRRRLHRRAQPRAADEPHGPLRVRAAGRRLPQAHPRGERRRRTRCAALGPHVVTLAETEGLPAHADSVRLPPGSALDEPGTRP